MRGFCMALAALVPLTAFATGPIVIYTLQDLGTLGGPTSFGNAVNASGVAVGYSYLPDDGPESAFISDTGGLRSLGTLGGATSYAQSINSSGQVAGASQFAENSFYHAFLSGPNGGVLTDLTPSAVNSIANGVNGAGQVAGYFVTAGANHAFLIVTGGAAPTDLGTLGGAQSFGNAVNASGQVVGYAGTASGVNHAFISDPNGGITDPNNPPAPLHDLGSLGDGSLNSFGTAINDAGQVAGRSSWSGSGLRAFRSGPNGSLPLLDLGSLGGSSFGEGINNSGAVVGYSLLGDNSTQHAFYYTTNLGLMDLNNLIAQGSGWVLVDAKAINHAGQITGSGTIGGQTHVFLLTPIPPAATITLVKRLGNGHLLVEGVGTPLETLRVEITSDLGMTFQPFTTIMAGADGKLSFEDPVAPTPPGRFYRFVYP